MNEWIYKCFFRYHLYMNHKAIKLDKILHCVMLHNKRSESKIIAVKLNHNPRVCPIQTKLCTQRYDKNKLKSMKFIRNKFVSKILRIIKTMQSSS